MKLKWVGINKEGYKVKGEFKGSHRELRDELNKTDIFCLQIKIKFEKIDWGISRISQKTLAEFTRQLSILFQANLEFVFCLQILAEENESVALQDLILKIKKYIENGLTIAESLKQFPSYFDGCYCALVDAAERSGSLKEILIQLADFQEQKLKLRSKLIKAIYYPCTTLVISLIITIGLLIFVVPQFKNIFDNFGAKLPLFTLMVIQLSNFIHFNLLKMMVFILLLFFIYQKYLLKSVKFIFWRDKFLLKWPWVGSLLCHWYCACWSRLLTILLTAGISLADSIQLSILTIPNRYYQTVLQQLQQNIQSGYSFLQGVNNHFIFPRRAKQMMGVGESGGQFIFMLSEASKVLRIQVEEKLFALTEWLEPVLMMILAILIGGLIIAMYLPVFRLGSAL